MNDGVIFYKSHFDNIKDLTDAELGQIFRACMTGETGAMAMHVKMAFTFLSSQIKRDSDKYVEIIEKRRAAGRMGGAPKGNKNAQKYNNQEDNENKQNKQKVEKTSKTSKTSNNINTNSNINNNINSNNNSNISTNVDDILVCTENATDVAENKEQALLKRKSDFEHSLIPFLSKYTREQIREFADYWTEPNKSHTKMRYELERTWDTARRLAYWDRNSKPARSGYGSNTSGKKTIFEEIARLNAQYPQPQQLEQLEQ
jgi:hypothetical protein